MTTALAYGNGKDVWMIADSMTNIYERPVASAKKIARFFVPDRKKDCLISITGFGGLMALIRSKFEVPDTSSRGAENQWWADRVAERITNLAIENSLLDDGRMDATALLAYDGCVWTLTHHMAVLHPDGIGAIGSGEGPAIGAFDALLAVRDDLAAAEVVAEPWGVPLMLTAALGIASIRDRNTGGEPTVEAA